MSVFILSRWCRGVNRIYPLPAGVGVALRRAPLPPLSHYFCATVRLRVWKLSLDAGFGCPNRDGTLGRGGCVFCDPAAFSPSRRLPAGSIARQIDAGIERLRGRRDAERFLAYFQPATNTYAPVDRLRAVYEEALAHPAVVGLAIGTRPDCVGDDVLDLLAELVAPDVAGGRVRPANDPRPVARLAEPRASLRRLSRRRGAEPPPGPATSGAT